jgi:glyoxylase-like metal-dependent hydrolase (beta-lactamase superfamily II)
MTMASTRMPSATCLPGKSRLGQDPNPKPPGDRPEAFWDGSASLVELGPQRIVIPLPLPLRTANAWLFVGERPALVDCGIGTPEGYEAMRRGLWDSGVDGAALHVYLTHGHMDHAGNAARLRAEFGAQVHAHAAEASLVATFRRDATSRYEAWNAALQSHGVPRDVILEMRRRGEAFDAWTADCPLSKPVTDAERLAFGESKATAHHAPGHTDGSVVYELHDGHVLTGDTLLRKITSNAVELTDAERGRYATYLQTLAGLRRFAGCTALPGHGEPFPISDALLDQHLAKHLDRNRRILGHLDVARSAWELMPRVFPRLVGEQAFLGMCEVVGHLHALELEGRVRMQTQDGVRRFVKA